MRAIAGRVAKSRWIAAGTVILCCLCTAGGRGEGPSRPDIAAAWRGVFKRMPPPPAPADNESTPEKIALGALLFSDPRLSGNGQLSCASCHQIKRAFTDGRPRARGIGGSTLRRNSPSLFNLAWSKRYFWDGRAASLEEQVQGPIVATDEMAGHWPTILHRLASDSALMTKNQSAFPNEPSITEPSVVKALASYVRSLVSPRTRFDAWVDGRSEVLTVSEQRGFELFVGKAGCVLCHVGWRFTDDRLHDIGLPSRDPGQGAVAGGTPGLKAFKTPGLRELARTAPYMHDGSLPTLQAVLAHYAGGFFRRPSLATNLNKKLLLSPGERADLVAFLQTLSDEQRPVPQPEPADKP